MKESEQESPEQLEAFRRSVEKLFQEAAERLFGPACLATDEVQVAFDWSPTVQAGCITFHAAITRGGVTSSIEFDVDLSRLETDELRQLEVVLGRRHAGIDTEYQVVRAIVWLVTISLRQQNIPADQIDAKVRKLLLFTPEKSNG